MTFKEELDKRLETVNIRKIYDGSGVTRWTLDKWRNGEEPKLYEKMGFLAYLDSIGITGKQ